MSKTVKAVVGIALLIYAPYLAVETMGFTAGTAGYYAAVGAVSLAGASISGSALAPKVPDTLGADTYAGQVLQTKKDNVSAVPQVFGECRIGSNIIWQSSSSAVSGTPRNDYWSIQVVSDTELESFEEMYSNEDVMDNKGSDIFTTAHTHIKGYKTSGVTPMSLNSVLFAKNSDGSTILGKDTEASTPFNIHPDWLSRSTGLLSWDSSNLVDDDYGTSGARFPGQTQQTANQWIEVDLQAPESVESMSIYHNNAYYTSGAIKLQYFNGSTWEDASRVYSFCWGEDCPAADFRYGLMTIDVETTNSYQKWRWFYPEVSCLGDSISIRELGIATTGRYDVTIPPNVAFIAVHQVFEANNNEHTQLDAITATVKGQKINDIKDDVVNNNIYYFPSGTYSSSSSSWSNLFDGNISTTGYRVAGDNLSLDMDNRIQFNSTSSTSPRNQTLIISAEIYIKTDIGLGIFAKDADGTSFGDPVVVSAGYEGWITLDNSDALDCYSEVELSDYWDIIFTGSGTGSDLEVEIREIRNVEWLERDYSYNPASQVLNLLTKGLNIPPISIDYPSFINASQKCSSYGYSSNIVFNSQRNIQSCIVDILATCRGQILLSQGKWKLKIDEKSATVVKAITSDDILNGSLSISMKGFSEVANKIDLKYINPSDNWLSAKVEKQDTDLVNMDGQEITKTLDIKGVTNSLQANKLAEITLNSMRYTEDAEGNRIKQAPLAISFATTVKNAELEVGDVFELQHDLLDRDRKFITLSVETDQSGAMQIAAREYCETHYKNSAGVYLI